MTAASRRPRRKAAQPESDPKTSCGAFVANNMFHVCWAVASVKNHMRITLSGFCGPLLSLLVCTMVARAENPRWIWHDNKGVAIQTNEIRFFRKTFVAERKPNKARLSIAADDEAVVYLNGKEIARPKEYDRPVYAEVGGESR